MAWAEGALWVAHYRERKIHKIDPATGKILRTIASDRYVTGVTWTNGGLWHGTWENDESELRRVSPETGEVQESLLMPPGVYVSGLEAGDGVFYCGGSTSGRIRAVRQPSPRPKAAERTPPPESGGGASRLAPRPSASWSRPRPALRPQGNPSVFPLHPPAAALGSAFRRASVNSPFGSGGMVQAPRRTGFSGPTLVRLLARLTDVDVPESGQSLSDRLSLWLAGRTPSRSPPCWMASHRPWRRAARRSTASRTGKA